MKKDEIGYEIKMTSQEDNFQEKLLLAYATGLASRELRDIDLERHAEIFIRGIQVYNKELSKMIEKDKKKKK